MKESLFNAAARRSWYDDRDLIIARFQSRRSGPAAPHQFQETPLLSRENVIPDLHPPDETIGAVHREYPRLPVARNHSASSLKQTHREGLLIMAAEFDRSISDRFLEQLQSEAQRGGWWADVLDHPELVVALRGKSLNVYWRGQSLFNVKSGKSGIKVTTHAKYLVDPALASQVPLTEGAFDVEAVLGQAFIKDYGPGTLAKMKDAAGLFTGLEKTGCHEIAVRNPNIIDVEIAFPGKFVLEDGKEKTAPRVDFASVEALGDEEARLVFWEAKDYANKELRAADGKPVPVCQQVKFYRACLEKHRAAVEESYTRMVENLVEIKRNGWSREISPLFHDIVKGKRSLTLGQEPQVRLVIFGFDSGQRDESGWQKHLARLSEEIAVVAAGDPKGIRLDRKWT